MGQTFGVAQLMQGYLAKLAKPVAGNAEGGYHAGTAGSVGKAHYAPVGDIAFGGADVFVCQTDNYGSVIGPSFKKSD